MLNHIRVYLVFGLLCLPLNVLLRTFVWDSFGIILLTSLWFAIGLNRLCGGPSVVTATFGEAARVWVMAMVWPLMPKTPRSTGGPTT